MLIRPKNRMTAGIAPMANMIRQLAEPAFDSAQSMMYAIRMPETIISWFSVDSRPRALVGASSDR